MCSCPCVASHATPCHVTCLRSASTTLQQAVTEPCCMCAALAVNKCIAGLQSMLWPYSCFCAMSSLLPVSGDVSQEDLSVCLPACLPACLPVCLPACLPAGRHVRYIDWGVGICRGDSWGGASACGLCGSTTAGVVAIRGCLAGCNSPAGPLHPASPPQGQILVLTRTKRRLTILVAL